MNKTFLSADEMNLVRSVFVESVAHVLGNYEETAKQHLIAFVLSLVAKEKSYTMVTPSGLDRAIKLAWSEEGTRDFLLKLSFTFFARMGQTDEFVHGLAHNLARGCSFVDSTVKSGWNAVPSPAGDRLADSESALNIITANRWLMIVLMIQLFIGLDAFKAKGK